MSSVDNIKTVIKLLASETKHIEVVFSNGKNLGADFTELLGAAAEFVNSEAAFALALSELKNLDAAGIDAIVAEITADVAFLPAKVNEVIAVLSSFISPVEKLIALFTEA